MNWEVIKEKVIEIRNIAWLLYLVYLAYTIAYTVWKG